MTGSVFIPRDPGFDRRVRASFARQGAMQLIGFSGVLVGIVGIGMLAFRADRSEGPARI